MVSSEQVGSGYFSVDAQGRLTPERLPLADLLTSRAKSVAQSFQAERELEAGTAVDELILYTVEDRPVVKERITEHLEKRSVAKEFVKEVKLVAVKDLPKYSETLNKKLNILTADVLATDPWLGERAPYSTASAVLAPAVLAESSIAPVKPEVPSPEIVEPKVVTNNDLLKTAQIIAAPFTQPQAAQTPTQATPKPIIEELERGTPPPSLSEAPTGSDDGTQSRASSSKNSGTEKSRSWRNPFKAFVKLHRKSAEPKKITPPASPKSPLTKNPFKNFVKHSKSGQAAEGQAIVPANNDTQVTPTKGGRGKKTLNWGFSQPFSGPQSPNMGSANSAVSGTAPQGTAQQAAVEKPTLEPFLDQSISNSDLGRTERSLPASEGNVDGQASSQSNKGASRTLPAASLTPQATGTGVSSSDRGTPIQHTAVASPSTGPLSSQPAVPANGTKIQASQVSQQETPNSPQGPGFITRQAVEEASNGAAIARCVASRDADLAVVDAVSQSSPFRETFVQIEEYETRHEVVEQFVEHHYFLLEHVIRTKYMGERRAEPFVEMLSRQRLLVTED